MNFSRLVSGLVTTPPCCPYSNLLPASLPGWTSLRGLLALHPTQGPSTAPWGCWELPGQPLVPSGPPLGEHEFLQFFLPLFFLRGDRPQISVPVQRLPEESAGAAGVALTPEVPQTSPHSWLPWE